MADYKVFDKNGNKINSDILLHPGEVLADELEARDISQKDFAKSIQFLPPHLNDLIKGKRNISAKIAIKLETELGIDADYWLRLQMKYDLAMERKQLALV
jgi:antitoxin HigA-1